MDDNFASLVTVLRWGRCVYNNIQKFIQFQLTINIAAIGINFIAPISAAIAKEKPTKEPMEKPLVGRTEPLITGIIWRNLPQSLYQIGILLNSKAKRSSE
ncbi:unnamed protein product [Malus baccata var. baccata]